MKEQYQHIKDVCLRLLTRREHSQKELCDKLVQRGFDRSSCEAVVADLAEHGWQSDQRYTESYARQRVRKGYGPLRITYELKQRGGCLIDLDDIAAEEASGSWLEILERVYLSRYADEKRLPAGEWLKRSRFLQQRGFSGDLIKALFMQLNIRLER